MGGTQWAGLSGVYRALLAGSTLRGVSSSKHRRQLLRYQGRTSEHELGSRKQEVMIRSAILTSPPSTRPCASCETSRQRSIVDCWSYRGSPPINSGRILKPASSPSLAQISSAQTGDVRNPLLTIHQMLHDSRGNYQTVANSGVVSTCQTLRVYCDTDRAPFGQGRRSCCD